MIGPIEKWIIYAATVGLGAGESLTTFDTKSACENHIQVMVFIKNNSFKKPKHVHNFVGCKRK